MYIWMIDQISKINLFCKNFTFKFVEIYFSFFFFCKKIFGRKILIKFSGIRTEKKKK